MNAVKRLLPVDGSPSSARVMSLVAAYRGPAALLAPVVLNVQSPPVMLWPEASLDAQAVERALLEAGREVTEAAVRRLPQLQPRPEQAVRLGLPASTIVREAETRRSDLIVMGTRGHGMVHGYAVGSVAMRVAHGGPTPVCVVRPESRLPVDFGRRLRVMLAVDGSAPAVRAAERLVAWQDWLGELDVQIMHVQEPLTLVEAILPPHHDLVEQWSTKQAQEASQEAREILATAGIRHHLHVSAGEPFREIALLAGQTQSELLVLGTRGRGAAHHALIGSVALKAAAASEIPVLLVK